MSRTFERRNDKIGLRLDEANRLEIFIRIAQDRVLVTTRNAPRRSLSRSKTVLISDD